MNPHYKRFLDALAGIPGDPVLFEPFIPVYIYGIPFLPIWTR